MRPLVPAVLLACALVAGCSSDDDAGSPPSTTTGVVQRSTTTLPSASDPSDEASSGLPGLWLATSAGITDERGEVWAEPAAGETLRSPLDDGAGGVFYLRCADQAVTCKIEELRDPKVVPTPLGDADNLLAVGTVDAQPVLLTSWTDPAVVPSFEENRSGLVLRLVGIADGATTVLPDWFGWESGPFAADAEGGRWAACSGEGEECGITTGDSPQTMAPIDGMEPATVMSLVLDTKGERLTWIETEPMSGKVVVRTMLLPGGTPVDVELQAEDDDTADDVVTDGQWVAVRHGGTITFWQVGQGADPTDPEPVGTSKVGAGVTEMALRPSGGGAASSVL